MCRYSDAPPRRLFTALDLRYSRRTFLNELRPVPEHPSKYSSTPQSLGVRPPYPACIGLLPSDQVRRQATEQPLLNPKLGSFCSGTPSHSRPRPPRPLLALVPQPHCPSAFQFQQPLLQLQPAAVAAKCPTAPEYPMTAHPYRHRVRAVGCSDRTDGLLSAEGLRHLHIAARCAERDRLQMTPDPLLEGCADHVERDIELAQL